MTCSSHCRVLSCDQEYFCSVLTLFLVLRCFPYLDLTFLSSLLAPVLKVSHWKIRFVDKWFLVTTLDSFLNNWLILLLLPGLVLCIWSLVISQAELCYLRMFPGQLWCGGLWGRGGWFETGHCSVLETVLPGAGTSWLRPLVLTCSWWVWPLLTSHHWSPAWSTPGQSTVHLAHHIDWLDCTGGSGHHSTLQWWQHLVTTEQCQYYRIMTPTWDCPGVLAPLVLAVTAATMISLGRGLGLWFVLWPLTPASTLLSPGPELLTRDDLLRTALRRDSRSGGRLLRGPDIMGSSRRGGDGPEYNKIN